MAMATIHNISHSVAVTFPYQIHRVLEFQISSASATPRCHSQRTVNSWKFEFIACDHHRQQETISYRATL